MVAVRQLGRQDILFVAGETDTVYHHVAGLVVLDISACPKFDFEHIRQKAIERISEVPHFRWKLHQVPLGLDLPYWVEDENFRYENHFKRIAVPSPGDRQALSEVVAYIYSRHLDRSKPLWEFWYIEGLEGGRVAILQKLHHCMMDGQGASKLGELLCDFKPNAKPRPVDPAISGAQAGEVPDWVRLYSTTAFNLARFPGAAYREMYDMVRPKLLSGLGIGKGKNRPKAEVPLVRFNGDIGCDRGFVFGSLGLDDIKLVKNAFDVSVNDVVLALVSTSLRHYLHSRGELPEASLRAGIAISLRSDDDDEISNHVTQSAVTLATEIEDPVARLRAIHEDCEQVKQLTRSGGKGMVEMLQVMPPLLVTALMATTTPEQASQMMGSNMIVSNVHGSDKPMYVAGARMETMYPMSILTPGMGINFTCVSYAGQVDFGVTIEPNLVPEPWEIIDGLGRALKEYLVLASRAGGARKTARKPARVRVAKATARKRPARGRKT